MRRELALPDALIADVYRAGMSARDLAVYLDFSPSQMGVRLKQLGVLRSRRESILLIRDRIGCQGEKHPAWKGGVCPRPDLSKGRWRSDTRPRIIERDGGVCVKCGGTRRLSVHHINPDGGDADGNLETLCSACHLLHHKPWEARWGRSESHEVCQ